MTTADEKERQIDAAWTANRQLEALLKPRDVRPFRADLPEEERNRLKKHIFNKAASLDERENSALALGWLVDGTTLTSMKITTHSHTRFTIRGYR